MTDTTDSEKIKIAVEHTKLGFILGLITGIILSILTVLIYVLINK